MHRIMEKQISIIIPTYNMEAYIGKCLDSLLIPDLIDVDILVINDGSKDQSSVIAHEYQNRYPESIRVIDKSNGNYGSCINVALPLTKGRYIKILDADDTFDTNAFSKFVSLLKTVDEDVIISSFITVNPDENIIKTNDISFYGSDLEEGRIYYSTDIFKTAFRKYTAMHKIAYNRRIFSKISYRQTEGISYTDVEWATIPMSVCETIRFYDLPVYRYLEGREGQTVNVKQVMKSLNHLFKVGHSLLDSSIEMPDSKAKDYVLQHAVDFHNAFYREILLNRTAESMAALQSYDEGLRLNYPDAYNLIGKIRYCEYTDFCIFSDLRRKAYSLNYKIPFKEKLRLSLVAKFNQIRNYLHMR